MKQFQLYGKNGLIYESNSQQRFIKVLESEIRKAQKNYKYLIAYDYEDVIFCNCDNESDIIDY